jgi:hypothetical protein
LVYLKSISAGCAGFVLSIALFISFQIVMASRMSDSQGAEVAVDVLALLRETRFWIIGFMGFGIGFWLQFRRA